MSSHLGHDSSVTVYDAKKDEFWIIEFDKVFGEKHYNLIKVVKDPYWPQKDFKDIRVLMNTLTEQTGIENDFHYSDVNPRLLPAGSRADDQGNRYEPDDYKVLKAFRFGNRYGFGSDLKPYTKPQSCTHHEAHAWCGYAQSKMKNAFVFTWDGGGDNTCFAEHHILDGEMTYTKELPYNLNYPYWFFGEFLTYFKETHVLDIAGKMMGMSSYGKTLKKKLYHSLDTMCDVDGKIYPYKKDGETHWQMLCRRDDERYAVYDNLQMHKTEFWGFQNNADFSLTIQKNLESFAVDYIESKLDDIKKCGNNVIISGGIALNVLVNELLKTKFPHIKFYVPSNPHDGGLSFGHLYCLLRKEGIVKRNDYNVIYNGLEVVDQHIYKSKKFKEVELEDVSRLLKEGNIIGFVNGRCEVGPRALGNRSILCDASYPNMKDKINRIKNREMYRPFAPACLKEDAPKYFESLHFENMEAMQYVVDVKEEYKEQLEPIVHVDGTARLQTVTKENNEVFYNLLKLHGGVLLNTSFNLAGKPTLNRLSDAFEMLDKTTLDYVVWGKDGKYKLYQ